MMDKWKLDGAVDESLAQQQMTQIKMSHKIWSPAPNRYSSYSRLAGRLAGWQAGWLAGRQNSGWC